MASRTLQLSTAQRRHTIGTISVIGSLNMDLVFSISRVPLAGETLAGSDFNMVPGGKGANQAVAASRSGAVTRMVGCVGADPFGQVLLDSLSRAGVNTDGIHSLPDISTGIANILVEPNGENRIMLVSGANARVTQAQLDGEWDQISKSALVVLQHEIPLPTVHSVIKRCQSEGIPVLLNPAPFYPVPQELLPMVDFLVLNETEATALTGMHILNVETAKQAARILYNYGRRTVIVTLGSTGAVLVNDEGLIFQPAFEVNAVDTTAAGDTFVGSFASSMLEGKSAAESLLFAAAASAISVTRLGAQASIPTRAEVESFLNSHRQSESSPPL